MQIRVLNVAEKPSAAKEIANILGQRPSSRQGHSPYNRIFDFEYRIPALGPGNCQMAMTSVAGHLMELEFPPQFRSWDRCNPKTLFEAPVLKSVKQNMSGIEKTLRSEAKKSQHLILWLDCDREGENIAFEVIQVCKEANSRLRIHRAKFSAFIPREIHGSMENLVAPDENMSNAVDARQEIDLRIGAAFTRFQTRLLGKYFPPKTIISYGPCQFPTLGFVLDRHYQIENFISEPYWNIDFQYQFNALNARENSSMVKFNWSRGPIYDQLCCLILYEICLENPLAKVTAVQRKEVKKWKPLPLSTITFQKLAAQKLRMSSHQAMEVAESLYQKGFVSYPRTETDQYSQDFDFHGCIRSQTGSPVYGEFASSLLDGNRFQRPRNGKNNDKAHPPIHPTKHPENLESLSQDQKKVFDIIVRHFLGSCSKDAIGDQTNVHVCIGDEQFTCSGLIIRERNYLDIYTYESWSTRTLPAFYEGQVFSPTIFEMTESRTSPPALLTEEELIALMYKNGIGTDATIPAHIETILKRVSFFKINVVSNGMLNS